MENEQDVQEVQETPEETQDDNVTVTKAELEELRKKADASSQNYARLKKLEEEMKGKEPLPKETSFDSASLERRIEEKVSLRMKGYDPDHILEIERYAKGAGIDSLLEAEKSPVIQKGLAALQAEKKTEESTPAPSNKVRLVGGKPADEVLKDPNAPASDKQAAFEAKMKRN